VKHMLSFLLAIVAVTGLALACLLIHHISSRTNSGLGVFVDLKAEPSRMALFGKNVVVGDLNVHVNGLGIVMRLMEGDCNSVEVKEERLDALRGNYFAGGNLLPFATLFHVFFDVRHNFCCLRRYALHGFFEFPLLIGIHSGPLFLKGLTKLFETWLRLFEVERNLDATALHSYGRSFASVFSAEGNRDLLPIRIAYADRSTRRVLDSDPRSLIQFESLLALLNGHNRSSRLDSSLSSNYLVDSDTFIDVEPLQSSKDGICQEDKNACKGHPECTVLPLFIVCLGSPIAAFYGLYSVHQGRNFWWGLLWMSGLCGFGYSLGLLLYGVSNVVQYCP
jgi:hypothetical protein